MIMLNEVDYSFIFVMFYMKFSNIMYNLCYLQYDNRIQIFKLYLICLLQSY